MSKKKLRKGKTRSSAPAAAEGRSSAVIAGGEATLGAAVRTTFQLFFNTALATFPLAIAFEAAMAILRVKMVEDFQANEYVAMAIAAVLMLPVYGAIAHLMMQKLEGRTLSLPAALKMGVVQWLTLLAATIVSQLVILFTLLYFLMPYALVLPMIIGEDKGWYDALQESRERMYGHRLKMLVLYLPVVVIANIVPLAVSGLEGIGIAVAVVVTAALSILGIAAVPVAIYATVTPRSEWKLTS